MAEEYHVENFGCRANRADGEAIASELRRRGMKPSGSVTNAGVVVVNTCSVTAQADRTARSFLRRVRRRNPGARILVTGCYAQRAPGEVAALPGVDLVIGNSHKPLLPELAVPAGSVSPGSVSPGSVSPGSVSPGSVSLGSVSLGFVPLEAVGKAPVPQPGWPTTGASIYVDQVFADRVFVDRVFVDQAFAHSPALAFPPAALLAAPATAAEAEHSRTRPNLKVQDGCANRCSFCVIPATRGPSRSMSLEACLRSVEAFVAGGGKELVLSGINLGRWGRDLTPPRTFVQLVSAILAQTSLERLRLSSIEPMDWTGELLALFRAYSEPPVSRLARHAHLPLQSGSDAILRAMHRRYRPWHYAEKLQAIRRLMPDAAIGADVMVGFPGESDSLFEESFAFIQAQPFTYLHLFPFSPRPGTPGWSLQRQFPVPPRVVEERMARLRRLIAAKNLSFRQSFVGRSLPAITLHTPESERSRGVTRALTDNFLEVELAGKFPPNRTLRAAVAAVLAQPRDAGLAGSPENRAESLPILGATRHEQCYS